MMKRVRFWEFINGDWVRLTLTPGDCIAHRDGGANEEGYRVSWHTWSYDDNVPCVRYSVDTDARDCDGRCTYRGDFICRLDQLAVRANYGKETDSAGRVIMLPEWQEMSEARRDFSAEAAGY